MKPGTLFGSLVLARAWPKPCSSTFKRRAPDPRPRSRGRDLRVGISSAHGDLFAVQKCQLARSVILRVEHLLELLPAGLDRGTRNADEVAIAELALAHSQKAGCVARENLPRRFLDVVAKLLKIRLEMRGLAGDIAALLLAASSPRTPSRMPA